MPGEETERPKQGVFKEELDPGPVSGLCARVSRRIPSISASTITADAVDGLTALELKARVAHVADALRAHLSPHGPTMLGQLVHIASAQGEEPALSGFLAWPVVTVVERHGVPWPDEALPVLAELTGCFSAEFAIRPFLREHPERTLRTLQGWTEHPDEHVRRLVSEGTRPRLPWGGRLRRFQADPTEPLALLEALRGDPSAYVRRSVANHLNDISKDHPERCVSTLRRWNEDPDEYTPWITRHALRTLVKAGHPGALALQGFDAPSLDEVQLSAGPSPLLLGDALQLHAELTSPLAQELLVDVVLGLQKARGGRSAKVFKWTRRTVEAGQTLVLDKALPLRPISTRRYYPGEHTAQLRVNGQDLGPVVTFELVIPE